MATREDHAITPIPLDTAPNSRYWLNALPAICLLFLLWIGLVDSLYAQNGNGTDELHLLTNDDLLSRGQALLDQTLGEMRATTRAVARGEFRLDRLQQAIARPTGASADTGADTSLPDPDSPDPESSRLEELAQATAAADIALEHTRRRLERLQELREMLGRQARRIEAARGAAQAFDEALERLEPIAMELDLRVADGTLPPADIPETLTEDALLRHRQSMAMGRQALAFKAQTVENELQQLPAMIAAGEQAVIDAQSHQAAVNGQYTRELKRQDLEQDYVSQTPEQILTELAGLTREQRWLEGSLALTNIRFNRQQAQVDDLARQLEALDADHTAAKAELEQTQDKPDTVPLLELTVEHHGQRLRKLRQLRSQLEQLGTLGQTLEGDATVLADHLFRMEVLAGLLESTGQGPNKAEAIGQAADRVAALLSTTAAAVTKAAAQREELNAAMDQSRNTMRSLRRRIMDLRLTQQVMLTDREWGDQLKDQPVQATVAAFQEMGEAFYQQMEEIDTLQEQVDQAQQTVQETNQKRQALMDPLMRQVSRELTEVKRSVARSLYDLAGLAPPQADSDSLGEFRNTGQDTPAKNEATAAPPEADPGPQTEADAKPIAPTPPSVPQQDAVEPIAGIEAYRSLLASRIRVSEEQNAYAMELQQQTASLQGALEQYIDTLSETVRLANRYYATAIELKKRVGSGELPAADIPENITDALKTDRLNALEKALLGALNRQATVEQELQDLSETDAEDQAILESLVTIRDIIGESLGELHELTKLEHEFQRDQESLDTTEQDRLQRAALRRMDADDRAVDVLLGMMQAEQEETLTQLLRGHYVRLILLENRLENLDRQRSRIEQTVSLAEKERGAITTLIARLKEHAVGLEMQRLEQETLARARLAPEQAEDIVQSFVSKTGHSLEDIPLPVSNDERGPLIETVSGNLVELQIQAAATHRWIDLFEQRLSAAGIDREIGWILDKAGNLDAEQAAIQNQLLSLVGHASQGITDESDAVSGQLLPEIPSERLRYLEGEIGLTRADRLEQRSHAALATAIQIAFVLLGAVLLSWLSNQLVSRAIRRASQSDTDSAQTLFVLNFLKGFAKVTIWVVAFVMVLSSLGFNIGAILAGLGIGGLAVAMAARESLANILGGITIFIERPFQIGDTIQIGSLSPGRVVGMTWRTTVLVDTVRYHYHIPNSKVADSTIKNYSRIKPVLDYFKVYVSPQHDPHRVSDLMMQALNDCKLILQDELKFIRLSGVEVFEGSTLMRYLPVWSSEDYSKRDGIRQEVWFNVWKRLTEAGIELRIVPFEGDLSGPAVIEDTKTAQTTSRSHAD